MTGSGSRRPEEAPTARPESAGSATAERVAFLGLGIMGAPMARNLRAAGFDVVVWNRTRSRAEALGAPIAPTPRAAAAGADVLITMVVDAPEVEAVLFGEGGAAAGLEPGALVVDMSTIAPSAVRRIGARLADVGVHLVDAPVTGSRPGAEDGTLTIMTGGEAGDVERARPLLEAVGERIVHAGPSGHGAMAKLLNNAVAAINTAALAEAFAAAEAYGLDRERLVEVMTAGSAASAMLDLKARPMLERDYEPLFKLAHMLKDVRHCLEEARALGYELRLAADAESIYAEADSAGLGEADFAAVAEAIRRRHAAAG